ncbi:MAG: C45 family autoproteolytic acyltransferase/hydrolase [Endomicrobiia bacterium]
MNFIKVKGTDYEMGFQQGKYFALDIQKTFLRLIKSEAIKTIKPPFLPNFIFANLAKLVVLKKWEKTIKILLPEYSDRIRGLSCGSNTSLKELYFIQAIEVMADEINYYVKKNKTLPFGCSSICVLPKILRNSDIIIAKNFDYLTEFATDHIVRISQPKNGYKSIEVTYKQIVGSHDGMNEKGLVVLYNYGLSIEKTQTRIPITLLVQKILQRCSNIDEAITFIKAFRYPNGAIITLVDATNRAVCVELSPEHISFRKPEDGILVATNFYLTEEMKKYDIPSNAYFSKNYPEGLKDVRVHKSNEERYYRILELIKKFSRLGIEEVEKILKDHSDKSLADDNTICRHGKLISTQVGMIFLPKEKKLKVFFNNPCRNIPYEFEFD